MSARITSVNDDEITLEIKIARSGSMLEAEETILTELNEAGCLVTGKALERFDADGTRIDMGDVKWLTKGKLAKTHQTP